MDANLLLQWLGRWLTPESLPAWIAAAIMAAALFYQRRRGRIRPSKIVVFEANRTLFTKLPEAERRLSMLFNGQEIESLAMIDLVVRNEGASTIEGIEFTIEVDEQARILAIQPQPAPPGVTIGHLESDPSEWEVIIDYLNPMSLAKEQVRLAVFCEPEPDVVQAKGGGKGWSLDFLDQAELEARKAKSQRARAFILLAFTPVALLCIYAAMAFGRFVEDRFFPDPTQQWWQGILVLAAVCGVAVGLLWPLFKMVDVIMEDLAPFPE